MYDEIIGSIGSAPSNYGGSLQASGSVTRTPTLKERLDHAVVQAEEQLAHVKEAREIFARNPDIEKLLNIMQRGRF